MTGNITNKRKRTVIPKHWEFVLLWKKKSNLIHGFTELARAWTGKYSPRLKDTLPLPRRVMVLD